MDRVLRYTRDAGFQEEKYRTSMLQPSWTKKELVEVLDSRIQVLVKDKYTNTLATHIDLLPNRMGKQNTIDYMLQRTHMRPRDLIQFFNYCIQQAEGKTQITPQILHEAEGIYSRERLRALFDEWFGIYPNLDHLTKLLYGRKEVFGITDFLQKELEDNCLQLIVSGQGKNGEDLSLMKLLMDDISTIDKYREDIVQIFYKVGLVGLKIAKNTQTSWSEGFGQSVSRAEINDNTRVCVHSTYWRTFGIIGHAKLDDDSY